MRTSRTSDGLTVAIAGADQDHADLANAETILRTFFAQSTDEIAAAAKIVLAEYERRAGDYWRYQCMAWLRLCVTFDLERLDVREALAVPDGAPVADVLASIATLQQAAKHQEVRGRWS